MSHQHEKKHGKHHDQEDNQKHKSHGGDDGQLSAAMQNKQIEGDVVAVLPLANEYGDKKPFTQINVNVGANDGVTDEMKAYLVMRDGTRVELNVMDVLGGASHLTHDGGLTESQVQYQSNLRVIFTH